jgi:hypothetical protein
MRILEALILFTLLLALAGIFCHRSSAQRALFLYLRLAWADYACLCARRAVITNAVDPSIRVELLLV